jgi:hypothetical protein
MFCIGVHVYIYFASFQIKIVYKAN